MKNRIFVVPVLAGLFLVCTSIAQAKPGKGKHDKGPITEDVIEELDLSKEQKGKLEKLRDDHQKKMQSIRQEKRKLRDEMDEALEKDDEKLIKDVHEKIKKNSADMHELRFSNMMKIREILETKEKKLKFHELTKKKFKDRMRSKWDDRDDRD